MSVSEQIAIPEAIERVIDVLQRFLPGALDEVLQLGGTDLTGLLPLRPPKDPGYFLVLAQNQLEAVLINHPVAGFVYQAAPSEIGPQQKFSGSSLQYDALQVVDLEIVIAYRMAPHDPFEYLGKKMTTTDVMAERGYRYNSGVIDVMRKRACDGDIIEDVQKVSDFAGAVEFNPDGTPLIGYSSSVWSIMQDVIIDYPIKET